MAGVLRKAGLKIEIHDDHFPQNAKDPEWLTAAGKKNWIVVTRDERIRYRVAERQAIRRAKVRAFVLAAQGDLRAEMLAEIFLKAPEGSPNRDEAEAAVHREDFTRRRHYPSRILIAFSVNSIKARL